MSISSILAVIHSQGNTHVLGGFRAHGLQRPMSTLIKTPSRGIQTLGTLLTSIAYFALLFKSSKKSCSTEFDIRCCGYLLVALPAVSSASVVDRLVAFLIFTMLALFPHADSYQWSSQD